MSKNLITRFERAVRAHEMMGAQPPEYHAAIEREYREAKAALRLMGGRTEKTSAIRGKGWNADCPKCRASKFTCDEHFQAGAEKGARCAEIADQVVPEYRTNSRTYSCTGARAEKWNVAYRAAEKALEGKKA